MLEDLHRRKQKKKNVNVKANSTENDLHKQTQTSEHTTAQEKPNQIVRNVDLKETCTWVCIC